MKFKLFLHPKAADFLNKLDVSLKNVLNKKINELGSTPKLIGQHMKYCNFWKLRIGNYRVIYEIKEPEKRVVVLFIGHRKYVYEKFSKVF